MKQITGENVKVDRVAGRHEPEPARRGSSRRPPRTAPAEDVAELQALLENELAKLGL